MKSLTLTINWNYLTYFIHLFYISKCLKKLSYSLSSLLSPLPSKKDKNLILNSINNTNFSDSQNPTILKTELNNKFVNIMEEKCVQSSELEPNAVKMDGFSRILTVEVSDANMILSPLQTWLGITEK